MQSIIELCIFLHGVDVEMGGGGGRKEEKKKKKFPLSISI